MVGSEAAIASGVGMLRFSGEGDARKDCFGGDVMSVLTPEVEERWWAVRISRSKPGSGGA
jgi:hypothetical protein